MWSKLKPFPKWVFVGPGSALLGGVIWTIALMILLPHPFDTAWAKLLLLLAPLLLLALAGLLTAWVYFLLAAEPAWPRLVRSLWVVVALSLTGSMVLAAMYGLSHHFDLVWLDIPWMRALHGTANALGFAWAGLVGWTVAQGHEKRAMVVE